MKKKTVIAEIGINHNGELSLALDMVSAAKHAGADVVKFQKRDVSQCYTPEELAAPCISPWGNTVEAKVRGRELSCEETIRISEVCKAMDIGFSCSAFDLSSLVFLDAALGPDLAFHKVPSAMAKHRPFLERVASYQRLTLVSVGLAESLEEVAAVAKVFETARCPYVLNVTTALYPTPLERCHLARVGSFLQLRSHGLSGLCEGIGYSGHEVGILPSVLAAYMGADWIERHFTLDRSMYGGDQAASLEPKGLSQLCRDVKILNSIVGRSEIELQGDEKNPVPNLKEY